MAWFRRNKKAFTLIEIVVVIGIIAILAAIVTVSTIAILKNTQKKAAASKLRSHWSITVTYFNQVNKGFTTYSTPQTEALATRLGTKSKYLSMGTDECSGLSDDDKGNYSYMYIQYKINETSLSNKYQVVAIHIRYKGEYYSTTDGQEITGPKSAP